MKILVLGGNGFVGHKLIMKLAKKEIYLSAAVRSIPANPNSACNYLLVDDLISGTLKNSQHFDVIINLAMKRSTKVFPVADAVLRQLNYEIPLEIIRKHSTMGTLVINTSTYIQNYQGVKGQTLEGYSTAKELLSVALESDAFNGKYRVLDLYLFTLYGPGDLDTHLVPLLLASSMNDSVISLSDGNQLINLLYVEDAVDSILVALNHLDQGYKAHFLWEPQYLTLRKIVAIIEEAFDKKLRIVWGSVPYGGHEMFEPWDVPFSKYPGLVVSTSLIDGIKLTGNFIRG